MAMKLINSIFKIEGLSTFKILEIFDYYDKPLLFSAESLSGQIFLISWIDDENNSKKWFYLPISKMRLERLKNNEIPLFDVFFNPEDDYLWDVEILKGENKKSKITKINPKSINKEKYLPEPNVYLDYKIAKEEDIQKNVKNVPFTGKFETITKNIKNNFIFRTIDDEIIKGKVSKELILNNEYMLSIDNADKKYYEILVQQKITKKPLKPTKTEYKLLSYKEVKLKIT